MSASNFPWQVTHSRLLSMNGELVVSRTASSVLSTSFKEYAHWMNNLDSVGVLTVQKRRPDPAMSPDPD